MGGKSWSSIFMIIWFGLYALFALTTISVTLAAAPILLGVVAILVAITLAFGK